MAHDIWYMVHGVWYMVYGIWNMEYGVWYMVQGIWYTVYGVWFKVKVSGGYGGGFGISAVTASAPSTLPYRGTSLIRNTQLLRITIGP